MAVDPQIVFMLQRIAAASGDTSPIEARPLHRQATA